jgi:hypothetical protein
MVIDTSGEWWTGSDAEDIAEYLHALTQDSYPVDEFRPCVCACGGNVFELDVDRVQGAARRRCPTCSIEHFICDSEEFWDDASPERWQCIECGTDQANVGIGFSLYEERNDVRWIYVGVRCSQCGVLGTFGDWKVGYSPSLHLLAKA